MPTPPQLFDFHLNPARPFDFYYVNHPAADFLDNTLDFHQAVHWGVVLQGDCTGEYGAARLTLSRGMSYLIPPWEPHRLCRSRTGFEVMLVSFSLEEFSAFFFCGKEQLYERLLLAPERRMAFLNGNEALRRKLDEFARELREIHRGDAIPQRLRQWQLITGCGVELLRTPLPPEYARQTRAADYHRLTPALRLLFARPGKVVDAATAAAACALSVGRFSHLFRAIFGIPFGRYELLYRLNGAAAGLHHRGMTLKDAAAEWGFCDASHLSRRLRQNAGTYSSKR